MILVLGALLDSVIAHVVHRLADRGIPFLLLDPREYGRSYELAWEWNARGEFRAWLYRDHEATPLTGLQSVYWRSTQPSPEQSDGNRCDPKDVQALFRSFLDTAPILVCNRPSPANTNFSKPWQLQSVLAGGFAVPRTLVTNIPDAARDFFHLCRRRVIYKSISSVRSIVRRMSDSDLDRLDLLATGPVQFQEWIPGTDIRVHITGSRIFATEIDSEATDYRYSGQDGLPRTMRGIELPDTVARQCVTLTRELGLVCAGIDLRRTPDGRYFCFEANTNPGFAFFEQYTGQRIADGLIDALLEGEPPACIQQQTFGMGPNAVTTREFTEVF